jgi:hypothetical protein
VTFPWKTILIALVTGLILWRIYERHKLETHYRKERISDRTRRVENKNLARKYRKYYLKKIGKTHYFFNTVSRTELTPYLNGRKVKFWLLVDGEPDNKLDAHYFPVFYTKKVGKLR